MIFKIYNFLRIILLFFFILISIYSLNFYEGSKIIFLTYCLSLILMIFYLTNKNSSYLEIFLSSYVFLGFWFKYVLSLIFFDGRVYDSGEINSSNIDEIMILSIVIVNTISFSSWISRQIIHRNNYVININKTSFFEKLYLNNRITVLLSFSLIIFFVSLINIQFNIHQRAFISLLNTNFIFINLLKWLLLFGFTTFSCFLIHTEITKNKSINFFTLIVATLEIFFSYTSMLSRSFIINVSSIILPTFNMTSKLKKNYNGFFGIFFLLAIILMVISIYVVNSIRINKLETIKHDWSLLNPEQKKLQKNSQDIENYHFEIEVKNYNTKKQSNNNHSSSKITPVNMFQFIIVNRWIGIDSLILVHNSGKTGFSLLLDAFKENKSTSENTFYEKTFNLDNQKINIQTTSLALKGNTLPGIISFLYYSGNIYFLIFCLIILITSLNFFEKFVIINTNNNLIFACFLSQIISTRLMHFGYTPKDSYLFLLSVCLSIFFIIFLNKFYLDFFKKKKM